MRSSVQLRRGQRSLRCLNNPFCRGRLIHAIKEGTSHRRIAVCPWVVHPGGVSVGLLDQLFQRWRVDQPLARAMKKDWAGNTEGAIADLQELIATSGSSPERSNAMAILLVKIGEPEEALVCSEQALTADPDRPEFIVTHTRALRRLGRYDEALSRIEPLYQLDKKNIFVAVEYAKLLIDMGQTDDASALLDRVDAWFSDISDTRKAKESGMTHAYREARYKLRYAVKRGDRAAH